MRRVGIIGAGALGRYHALRLQQLGITVDAVYDVAPEAAASLAADTGATACGSMEEVIRRVDLVCVCTPPTAHRAPTVAALQAGRPVICEKPLARTLDDAKEMVRVSEQTGVPLFVAHVVRFFGEYARVHSLVAQGSLGKPGVYRSSRVGPMPQRPWFADETQSGGVILDVMIHDFDFARWCCGEVERIFVRRARWTGEAGPAQHALAVLRFAGGAIGHIEGSWSLPAGHWHTHVEIAGDGGIAEVRGTAVKPIQGHLHSGERVLVSGQPGDDPYLAELRHFLDCLTRGATPIVTARDGLAALQIALAGMESADTGRPVTLTPITID